MKEKWHQDVPVQQMAMRHDISKLSEAEVNTISKVLKRDLSFQRNQLQELIDLQEAILQSVKEAERVAKNGERCCIECGRGLGIVVDRGYPCTKCAKKLCAGCIQGKGGTGSNKVICDVCSKIRMFLQVSGHWVFCMDSPDAKRRCGPAGYPQQVKNIIAIEKNVSVSQRLMHEMEMITKRHQYDTKALQNADKEPRWKSKFKWKGRSSVPDIVQASKQELEGAKIIHASAINLTLPTENGEVVKTEQNYVSLDSLERQPSYTKRQHADSPKIRKMKEKTIKTQVEVAEDLLQQLDAGGQNTSSTEAYKQDIDRNTAKIKGQLSTSDENLAPVFESSLSFRSDQSNDDKVSYDESKATKFDAEMESLGSENDIEDIGHNEIKNSSDCHETERPELAEPTHKGPPKHFTKNSQSEPQKKPQALYPIVELTFKKRGYYNDSEFLNHGSVKDGLPDILQNNTLDTNIHGYSRQRRPSWIKNIPKSVSEEEQDVQNDYNCSKSIKNPIGIDISKSIENENAQKGAEPLAQNVNGFVHTGNGTVKNSNLESTDKNTAHSTSQSSSARSPSWAKIIDAKTHGHKRESNTHEKLPGNWHLPAGRTQSETGTTNSQKPPPERRRFSDQDHKNAEVVFVLDASPVIFRKLSNRRVSVMRNISEEELKRVDSSDSADTGNTASVISTPKDLPDIITTRDTLEKRSSDRGPGKYPEFSGLKQFYEHKPGGSLKMHSGTKRSRFMKQACSPVLDRIRKVRNRDFSGSQLSVMSYDGEGSEHGIKQDTYTRTEEGSILSEGLNPNARPYSPGFQTEFIRQPYYESPKSDRTQLSGTDPMWIGPTDPDPFEYPGDVPPVGIMPTNPISIPTSFERHAENKQIDQEDISAALGVPYIATPNSKLDKTQKSLLKSPSPLKREESLPVLAPKGRTTLKPSASSGANSSATDDRVDSEARSKKSKRSKRSKRKKEKKSKRSGTSSEAESLIALANARDAHPAKTDQIAPVGVQVVPQTSPAVSPPVVLKTSEVKIQLAESQNFEPKDGNAGKKKKKKKDKEKKKSAQKDSENKPDKKRKKLFRFGKKSKSENTSSKGSSTSGSANSGMPKSAD